MPQYPRLLNLDDDTKERLISFINTELDNHFAERGKYVANLEAWAKDYWVEPSKDVRTFPFYGASNLIIPLTAISVEAVHARVMTTLFAVDPYITSQFHTQELPSGAETALERYVQFELDHSIGFKKSSENIILELEKFGTGIGKSGYEKVVKRAVRTVGDQEQEFDVVTKATATIDPVAGSRFMMPFTDQCPQTSMWCGEEHSENPYTLKLWEEGGLFYPGTFEAIDNWIQNTNQAIDSGSGQSFTQKQEKLEDKKPVYPKRVDWVELWLAFDINQGGRQLEIVVHFHREAQFLMAVRYNWNDDLSRPYRTGPYIPVEHRWNGVGICKQNDQFQREITTIHRQRLDNATLANMRMFKVHKLSGYGPKEPIFPGKMWFLDDMAHMDTLQLGEIYPSAYSNEQGALIYSQQRTGVNEVILGMPQVGTPGTATGDIARIQEGNKKFDYALGNIKTLLGSLVMDAFMNIKQFGTRNTEYFSSVENADLILAVMNQPAEVIRRGILFDIGMVTSKGNRMLDRQNWVQIQQALAQYYQAIMGLAQMVGDPNLMGIILKKALVASNEATRQLLESFELRNIDRIIVPEIERLVDVNERSGPNNLLVPGGNSGPEGNGGAPGMDALSQILASLGTGGAQ